MAAIEKERVKEEEKKAKEEKKKAKITEQEKFGKGKNKKARNLFILFMKLNNHAKEEKKQGMLSVPSAR